MSRRRKPGERPRDPARVGSTIHRVLAELGYDAAALASVLANRAAELGAPRVFDVEGLTQASGFSGIDGIFRFLPTGEAQRGLAVLEMRRGGFRLLSPAPQTFEDLTS